MNSLSDGYFTFHCLNSPPDAPLIKEKADFYYINGRWYLNSFDYGCPEDCHSAQVGDGPDKRR
ncbi:MAG TPA: hypothetical protein VGF59_32000 [Bryobacteraceae bacterium]